MSTNSFKIWRGNGSGVLFTLEIGVIIGDSKYSGNANRAAVI